MIDTLKDLTSGAAFLILELGTILLMLDIFLGIINHVFKYKDSVSALAINSLIRKAAVLSVWVAVPIVTMLIHHSPAGAQMYLPVKSAGDTLGIALLFHELQSVTKHFYLLTGLDILKMVPGITAEIERAERNISQTSTLNGDKQ